MLSCVDDMVCYPTLLCLRHVLILACVRWCGLPVDEWCGRPLHQQSAGQQQSYWADQWRRADREGLEQPVATCNCNMLAAISLIAPFPVAWIIFSWKSPLLLSFLVVQGVHVVRPLTSICHNKIAKFDFCIHVLSSNAFATSGLLSEVCALLNTCIVVCWKLVVRHRDQTQTC